jgi:hypothetical protein
MTVTYDRSQKTYTSDIVEGAWPTRLDAEAAELPAALVDKAQELAGSLKVALKAVRLVVNAKVKLDGSPDVYQIPSNSHPGLPHTVDLSAGCDCEAYAHGIVCSHWTAALLVASNGGDDDEPEPQPAPATPEPCQTRNQLIEELFGPTVQVKDAAGRVVFG